MSVFDLISELRKGTPDVKKAARAMKILGFICLAGAAFNFLIAFIEPSGFNSSIVPPEAFYLTLIGAVVVGLIFLRAGSGISQMEPWGKKTGQLALGLLICLLIALPAYAVSRSTLMPHPFAFIIMAIVMAQFIVPAYLGIRYLGRLPVNDGSYASYRMMEARHQAPAPPVYQAQAQTPAGMSVAETKYKDALLPFGLPGTFMLVLVVPMALAFALTITTIGDKGVFLVLPPLILFIFIGPVIYNNMRSPFQEKRTLIASFTGGGSTYMFNGSWPFFRLMVYADGVEIRVFFHRFFIPYDKMDDLPDKIGFFSTGILFKSDLPGVPGSIRYKGLGLKKTLAVLAEARNKFMEQRAK